jgi:hypothetical protein
VEPLPEAPLPEAPFEGSQPPGLDAAESGGSLGAGAARTGAGAAPVRFVGCRTISTSAAASAQQTPTAKKAP